MSDIFIMEAANLFCGDHDPTASKHLTLSELQLPTLTEMFVDHHAGGSAVQIEIPTGIEKMTSSFKLMGWDPELMGQFGLSGRGSKRYTAYGVLRSRRTGLAQKAMVIMEGRLGKVESEAFKRGEAQSHDYAINGIVHYEMHINETEKISWDFFTAEWRVDGVQQNADEARMLNLPV
jgi:P2 family phage contractile tail tube protein